MDQLSTSTRSVPISWVESLFARMSAVYGNKFVDMWKGCDIELIKTMWAAELGKLSNEELKRGYSGLMSKPWPPTLPEYFEMCRPKIDPLTAYYEALAGITARHKGEMGEWSHPAIFWAAIPLSYNFLNETYSQIKPAWESALKAQQAKNEWEPILPAPLIALEAPKSVNSRKNAEKTMQDLGIAKALTPRTDYRAWIDKVLANKYAPMIARKFALEARQMKHEL
jgi:hypothetical protein